MSRKIPGTLRKLAAELWHELPLGKELAQRAARELTVAEDQLDEAAARYVALQEEYSRLFVHLEETKELLASRADDFPHEHPMRDALLWASKQLAENAPGLAS